MWLSKRLTWNISQIDCWKPWNIVNICKHSMLETNSSCHLCFWMLQYSPKNIKKHQARCPISTLQCQGTIGLDPAEGTKSAGLSTIAGVVLIHALPWMPWSRRSEVMELSTWEHARWLWNFKDRQVRLEPQWSINFEKSRSHFLSAKSYQDSRMSCWSVDDWNISHTEPSLRNHQRIYHSYPPDFLLQSHEHPMELPSNTHDFFMKYPWRPGHPSHSSTGNPPAELMRPLFAAAQQLRLDVGLVGIAFEDVHDERLHRLGPVLQKTSESHPISRVYTLRFMV